MNSWNNIEEMAELKKHIGVATTEFEAIVPKTMEIKSLQPLADKLRQRYNKLVVCAILLYCYAPRSLVGEKLPKMMSRLIARAAQCHTCYLARKKHEILFLYQHDDEFHKSIEDAMNYIANYQPCA